MKYPKECPVFQVSFWIDDMVEGSDVNEGSCIRCEYVPDRNYASWFSPGELTPLTAAARAMLAIALDGKPTTEGG